MRRIFPLIMLLMTGSVMAPARADLTHRMSSSTQLSVNGAYTDASRIGSTYTVSGSNIKVDTSNSCLLYTSPSPRDLSTSRMPSSA